jgi:hypothetical protein
MGSGGDGGMAAVGELPRESLVAPADQPARATRLGGKWLLIARADQAQPDECCTMDYAAEPLKRPNQTMAGSWVGLHDRPVYPALSREAASMAAAGPFRS